MLIFYLGPEPGTRDETQPTWVHGEILHEEPSGWTEVSTDNSLYLKPPMTALSRAGLTGAPFRTAMGDLTQERRGYLVKNRAENSFGGTIVRCMVNSRHWAGVNTWEQWAQDDPPFLEKMPVAVWRGTTTGLREQPGNRFSLVERWFGKGPQLDVAFSSTCQDHDECKEYVAGRMRREEMLRYRYIISARGNDKDSGLNWKLCSNSVVLMVPPAITSWLMEPFLRPWVHYVPLDPDYADLLEKVKWCEAHPNESERISRNARMYMSMFMDEKVEQELENKVLRRYVAALRSSQ